MAQSEQQLSQTHSVAKHLGAYLEERSLTIDDAVRFGCKVVGATELIERLDWKEESAGYYLGGLWMPGRSPDGTEQEDYGHAVFFTKDNAFTQPIRKRANTRGPNRAVFLPYPNGAWTNPNPERVHVFTESYLKGVVCTLAGFPTVVLNGVEGWSGGNGALLDDLQAPLWQGLTICPLFDSLNTANENSASNVRRARRTLASFMHNLSECTVLNTWLPEPPEELELNDWGVDDFVAHSGQAALQQLILDSDPHEERDLNALSAALADFNSRFAYIRSASRVLNIREPDELMKPSDFKVAYAPVQVRVPQQNRRGVTMRQVKVAERWVDWEQRHTLGHVVFKPGQGLIHGGEANLWHGFATTPSETTGSAEELWLQTVRDIFPEGWEELVSLLAAIVQRPGEHPSRYIFASGKFGTGKNFVFKPLQHILGHHAISTPLHQYANKFNKMLMAARLILVSEVEERIDRKTVTTLEAEIKMESDASESTRRVEPKGTDSFEVERCALLVLLSNFDPPWSVQAGDRRGLFLRADDSMAIKTDHSPWGTKTEDYWTPRWVWMDDTGPAEVHRLLAEWPVDYSLFRGPPTVTAYKNRLMQGSLESGGWSGWARKIVHFPDEEWAEIQYATTEMLCRLRYADDTAYEYSTGHGNALGQFLAHEGAEKKQVKVDGRKLRVWKIRGSKWDTGPVVGQHLQMWNEVMEVKAGDKY